MARTTLDDLRHDPPTVEEYLEALRRAWPCLGEVRFLSQDLVLRVLRAQQERGGDISDAELANDLSYATPNAANSPYGKFARAVAEALGLRQGDQKGRPDWFFALGGSYRDDETGRWVWTLRDELVEALRLFPQTAGIFDGLPAREPGAEPHAERLAVEQGDGDALRRALVERLARDNQADFRRRVLNAYGYRCAVTHCEVEAALEAAHLDRFANSGNDDTHNGVLLRADLHRLLDSGLLWFDGPDDDGAITVTLASALSDDLDYGYLHGQPIAIPDDPAHAPSPEALARLRALATK